MLATRPLALLALGALVLTGAACGPPPVRWVRGVADRGLEGVAVVPLLDGALPYAHVLVDGHVARAVIDTGAESTLVDTRFAEESGLRHVALDVPVHSYKEGRTARTYDTVAVVGRLELGDAWVTDLQTLVFDMAYFGEDLDMILGMDVLEAWGACFDDARRELRLFPGGTLATSLSGVFESGTEFTVWPWSAEGSRPLVAFDAGEGRGFDVLVDTGAVLSSLPRDVIEFLELEESGSSAGHDIGGANRRTTHRLARLDLGGVALKDLDVQVYDEPHGLLGYAALRNFAFVVDGPERTFAFANLPERGEDDEAPPEVPEPGDGR